VDLVLLDLKLPGHDGFEVIRGARSYLKLRETVIVVLSALSNPDDEMAALNLGADAFYQKPASLKRLEARLKPLVRRIWDRFQ
jgi:DNA-binding response OmpR family regulator